ncbi:hypothetical protein O3P69_018051 [Scylla paramamosain]|uniref:Uncharacterized protein n=1 Tax=Scylla paramamosain TaxID=85552 RepID=A0AAW0TI43_SCYPA
MMCVAAAVGKREVGREQSLSRSSLSTPPLLLSSPLASAASISKFITDRVKCMEKSAVSGRRQHHAKSFCLRTHAAPHHPLLSQDASSTTPRSSVSEHRQHDVAPFCLMTQVAPRHALLSQDIGRRHTARLMAMQESGTEAQQQSNPRSLGCLSRLNGASTIRKQGPDERRPSDDNPLAHFDPTQRSISQGLRYRLCAALYLEGFTSVLPASLAAAAAPSRPDAAVLQTLTQVAHSSGRWTQQSCGLQLQPA